MMSRPYLPTISPICVPRLLPLAWSLSVIFLLAARVPCGAAEAPQVGVVNKVEHEAEIVAANGTTPAAPGAPVHLNDMLRTGPEGRLQVTFRDDSILTLGEKASVSIDRYIFDPDAKVGETVLIAAKGAFRFASGRIKQLKPSAIQVATPLAVIGVRGTEFWGGPLDETYGILLLEGEVTVTNGAGSVSLARSGEGTDVRSADEAPEPAKAWSDPKVARAVESVAFH